MSLWTDIFGGGDQETTQTNVPWGPIQPYILDNMATLQEGAGTRQYYPGDTVANLTPEQLMSLNMMTNAAGAMGDYNMPLMTTMKQYTSPDFMDPANNPWMQGYVDAATRPVTEAFTEGVLPGIRSNARLTGGADYGSTRQGVAEGIATRGYLDTVGDISKQMWGDLYGTNLGAQQRGMAMSPMLAQMMGVPAEMYGQAGSILQTQEQGEIAGDIERYNYNRDIPYMDAAALASLASGMPYGSSTTIQPGAGPLSGMIGTAATLYGMYTGNPALSSWGMNNDYMDVGGIDFNDWMNTTPYS